MPTPEQLPDELKDLAYRNGFELSHTRWDSDVREMTKRLGLGKADVQESRSEAIVAAGARTPVTGNDGAVVAGRAPGSTRIAIGAAVALFVLAGLVALLMWGGDSNSTAQSASLLPTGATTPETQSPASASPVTTPTSAPARDVDPKRSVSNVPPPTRKQDPVVPAASRPTSTIRAVVLKEGGTPGTQRSPQLDHQETFETAGGGLTMEFELSRGACSKARLHIFIDGKPVRQTEFFDDTTGLLDLGPVPGGKHTLTLSPEGQQGGCNSGTLGSWGGTLTLHVSG